MKNYIIVVDDREVVDGDLIRETLYNNDRVKSLMTREQIEYWGHEYDEDLDVEGYRNISEDELVNDFLLFVSLGGEDESNAVDDYDYNND